MLEYLRIHFLNVGTKLLYYFVGQNNKSQVLLLIIRMPYRSEESHLVPLCCQMNISTSVNLYIDSFPFTCFIC